MGENKRYKLDLLYDHYKDSFSLQREYLKQRDRLFLYSLAIVTGILIILIVPKDSYEVINEVAAKRIGSKIYFTPEFLDSILWFLLLIYVLKYFQATITVERQYMYIHELEARISDLLEDKFDREGNNYLTKFNSFSDVAWFFYTVLFPMFIIIIPGAKILNEIIRMCTLKTFHLSTLFNVFLFFSTSFLVVKYIVTLHFKK